MIYQQQLEREGEQIQEARRQLQVVEQNREHFQQVWERELRQERHRSRERDRDREGWSR